MPSVVIYHENTTYDFGKVHFSIPSGVNVQEYVPEGEFGKYTVVVIQGEKHESFTYELRQSDIYKDENINLSYEEVRYKNIAFFLKNSNLRRRK